MIFLARFRPTGKLRIAYVRCGADAVGRPHGDRAKERPTTEAEMTAKCEERKERIIGYAAAVCRKHIRRMQGAEREYNRVASRGKWNEPLVEEIIAPVYTRNRIALEKITSHVRTV